MPALGPVSVRKRTAETIVRLVGHMRRRWGTDRGGAAGTGQTALELAEGLETRQGQATAPLAVKDARRYSRQAHA
jgi:hypothetical protein